MNPTQKGVIYIFCFLCLALTLPTQADAVDPNLLRKNQVGEERPSWWFDIWYESGITVLASIKQEIPEKPEISLTIEIEEGVDTTRIGFSAVEVDIKNVIDIRKSENYLNSDTFKNGAKITVYVYYEFNNKRSKWAPIISIKDEEHHIMHLSKIGPALPGSYYIEWSMRSKEQKTIEEIVKARKAAMKDP
jgi:hypothetical protein